MAAQRARRIIPMVLDSTAKAYLFAEKRRLGGSHGRYAICRTLEHLEQVNIPLKESVQSVTVTVDPISDSQHGARQFCYEHLPQLRFSNPSKEIEMIADSSKEQKLTITHEDGHLEDIDINGRDKASILKDVINIAAIRLSDDESL